LRILHSPAVYVSEHVSNDPRAQARAERLLSRIVCDEVQTVSDEEIDDLVTEHGWDGSRRRSGRQRQGDPPMLLDVQRWAPEGESEAGKLRRYRNRLLGTWHRRDAAAVMAADGVVCQSGYGLHSGRGCLFKCDYCYLEDVLVLALNTEELIERMDPIVRGVSGPALWKWDNVTDTLPLEPELGATRPLVEYFAQFDDQYLMTYSKSDNVAHMLDLEHAGQTICCWTLNADTQSRLIERDTATTEQRILAARACQQAGYTVRFRLSAVCPVHGWQEENRRMLQALFANVRPDVISLETLSRMPEPGMFDRVMDRTLFEERFLDAIDGASEEMAGHIWGPLPDDAREEIWNLSPRTPVSLCQEPPAMWERLSDVLTMGPEHYVCCCAQDSVPGHPLLNGLQ
jgi:hypothetical protein